VREDLLEDTKNQPSVKAGLVVQNVRDFAPVLTTLPWGLSSKRQACLEMLRRNNWAEIM
jgi:hypothetical protein